MSDTSSFWARRKAAVAAEAEAEQAASAAEALAEEHRALEAKSDAEILAEFDLPDPDSMKLGDDFSAFMAKAVPDRIRRRALRTLWRSNPVLANVDMLVDYGEDYTDKATVVENMQTAYQIGKGMLKHVEEMARQAEDCEPEAVEEEEEILVAEAPATASEEAPAFGVADTDTDTDTNTDIEADAEGEAPAMPTPRRMKFRSEEQAA